MLTGMERCVVPQVKGGAARSVETAWFGSTAMELADGP